MSGLVGKLLVAGAVLLAVVGSTAFFVGGHSYTIQASFLSAEGLVPQNDVVIGGKPVGTVTEVRLGAEDQSQGGAIVEMQINGEFAPLHEGTHATIRQKGLLGNMFVDLQPGSATSPTIPSGGVLPVTATSTPVDLDQITDIFDKTTREKIRTLTREGGTSLNGRGADINQLLAQLPAITANTTDITASIDTRDQALSNSTAEFDQIAYEMAVEDQSFRNDLTNGASILNTLAAHDTAMQNELTFGNSTLTLLNEALDGHQNDLRLLLQEMPGLIDQVQQFSDTNSTALAIIDPCVGDVIQAISEMRSAQAYKHPQNSQDGIGQMLRVSTVPVSSGVNDTGGGQHPANQSCSGGTP